MVTPPSTVGLVGPSLAQYQYAFPNVIKVTPPHNSNNLSVVSGPAPVVQRPDVSSAGLPQPILTSHPTSAQATQSNLDNISGLRSTKSQRIRGASNNLRMKQIEMRENHAVVYS